MIGHAQAQQACSLFKLLRAFSSQKSREIEILDHGREGHKVLLWASSASSFWLAGADAGPHADRAAVKRKSTFILHPTTQVHNDPGPRLAAIPVRSAVLCPPEFLLAMKPTLVFRLNQCQCFQASCFLCLQVLRSGSQPWRGESRDGTFSKLQCCRTCARNPLARCWLLCGCSFRISWYCSCCSCRRHTSFLHARYSGHRWLCISIASDRNLPPLVASKQWN